ncbi:enoyl-CoA hydratase/isomerase family protein [Demequina sediminicola]|uniref:enoyl-CoA hydratase/isomerase family protein n=1 Tax=Demequina sediminicola TaxID=1095026 RepID=UPI000784B6F9|nr:enoyl-CoA hydratase/isomerase family protein [Demequina sediminicola]
MPAHILVDTADSIAHITFARPERLNAFDFTTGEEYREACKRVAASPDVSAIIISAQGPAFCAGGDVLAMAAAGVAGEQVTAAAHVIHEGILALVHAPVPVVAAVQGAVAGGGIGLMLAADYIVAAPNLRVAGKYADIGLTPDLGVSTLLTRSVGERRALQILVGGAEVDADTAMQWGLITEVKDEPLARAAQIASMWSQAASDALGQAKRLIRTSAERTFSENLADEAHTIGQAYASSEAQTRIAAFSRMRDSRDGEE